LRTFFFLPDTHACQLGALYVVVGVSAPGPIVKHDPAAAAVANFIVLDQRAGVAACLQPIDVLATHFVALNQRSCGLCQI
jgi:hypothetical protein